jgi:hypothetical protein
LGSDVEQSAGEEKGVQKLHFLLSFCIVQFRNVRAPRAAFKNTISHETWGRRAFCSEILLQSHLRIMVADDIVLQSHV